ncbi:MAG: ATPase [Lachnospiraceae bacterium]|nr:ATPase [Lachnospiraceae bacterium]
MRTITVEELLHTGGRGIIIDMRSRKDFDKEAISGAIHMDISLIRKSREGLPKNCPLYFLCYTGDESGELVCELEEEGFCAYNVEGGFREYLRYRLKEAMGGSRLSPENGTKVEKASQDRETASERTFPNSSTLVAASGDISLESVAASGIPGSSTASSNSTASCRQAERSIIKKFRRELWCRFTKAIKEYDLIQDGDRIAVCISGGKDSMLMAKLFQELYRHGKRNFELVFLVMNPGYNEQNYQRILDNAKLLGVPVTVFRSEIFNIVESEETSPCYLCARMRRGYLYSRAKELGCNKIALGHHYDDVIETILMGMLYGGQMQTMMPKLHSNNFEGMELIRPMYLIREKDIIRWAEYNDLHFIRCACRFTENCASCGGAEKGSKRAEVKQLIAALAERDPEVESNIFRSVENVNLNTVIAWKQDGVRHHFLDTYY